MGVFLGNIHPALAALALVSYALIGVVIPTIISRSSGTAGKESRTLAGTLSGFVLDSLRGLGEVVQFGAGETRLAELDSRSNELIAAQRKLRNTGAAGQAIATGTIMVLSCAQMLLAVYLCNSYSIDLGGAILATVATFSSFGPLCCPC